MAATSGVNMSVRLVGREMAQARLAAVGRNVEPVLRGTLNTTATRARSERYIKPMRGLFKSSLLGSTLATADIRGRIAVKRAGRNRLNSRVIPSSSSIRVDDYRTWFFEWIDQTRARIWVIGLGGRKMAAGFVNPSSRGKRPLSTRNSKTTARGKTYSKNTALSAALGPSTAYWFKQLSGSGTIRWTNIFLQQEFERRIRREIAKYSR